MALLRSKKTRSLQIFYEGLIVALICVVLVAVYFWLSSGAALQVAWIVELIKNLVPNLIATSVVFLAVIWYTRRLSAYTGANPPARLFDVESNDHSVPIKTSPQSVHAFVQGLNNVRKIQVMAITGEVTVREVLNAADRSSLSSAEVEFEILLRSSLSTDKKRGDGFKRTLEEIRTYGARHPKTRLSVRTYSSTCPFHAILCQHQDGQYSGLLSYYDWTSLDWRESASGHSFVESRRPKNDPRIGVYVSWFDHLWGKHKLHTLLFDFDDTLFLTTTAQVTAWTEAISDALEKKLIRYDDLDEEVRSAFRTRKDLPDLITNIFLDEQEAEAILNRVLGAEVPRHIRETIQSTRISRRDILTKSGAVPIAGIIKDLKALSSEYQLVIVSATAESTIMEVLRNNGITEFSFVLGREAQRRQWELIETKAQHFLRVSNMLGIPLERMAFIGDSDADYRAATQLGLYFIENRFNANKWGRETLIRTPDIKPKYFISKNAAEGELIAEVGKIDASLGSGF